LQKRVETVSDARCAVKCRDDNGYGHHLGAGMTIAGNIKSKSHCVNSS
jgi:hypothetical protein